MKTVSIDCTSAISINFYSTTFKNVQKNEVYSILFLQMHSFTFESFLQTTHCSRIEVNKEVKTGTPEDFITCSNFDNNEGKGRVY